MLFANEELVVNAQLHESMVTRLRDKNLNQAIHEKCHHARTIVCNTSESKS